LIADLDTLSLPVRNPSPPLNRGIRAASLLASRGCLYNCSFCSIRQFYGSAPGPLRRVRAPEAVVAEMRDLFERYGVRFFMFQDDDFAAKSPRQRRWVDAFLRTLDRAGLTRQVRWRIACRVDEVDEELFTHCRDHGLIAVYLGVESGSPAGLRTLNKRVTVEQNLAAVETLKRIGVAFEMGFMLFDPDSTISTIQENIDFLRQATGDGVCPANFCKMLPYAGTPIEARLRKEGRLKGNMSQPDYDFLDPRIGWYALFAAKVFRFRNFDRLGLVERLRFARFDQVLAREFEAAPWADEYGEAVRELTARLNAVALDVLEKGLRFVAKRDVDGVIADWPLLGYLADQEWQAEVEIQHALDRVLAIYSPELRQAAAEEFSRRLMAGQLRGR
jgi:anaerobic magnesium-protoporphyrin IX monomethyl ester cyclase